MRSLGLDVGDRRTGVAIGDPQGILATPLTVLVSEDDGVLIDKVLRLVEQHRAELLVIGLPRHLTGELGKQAGKVATLVNKLSCAARERGLNQLDIQLWDERLSTKAAERLKTGAGEATKLRTRAKRGTRGRSSFVKAGVDAIAAAFILQGFLDRHRQNDSGAP
jgi:putative Holliday junction resolvase